MWSGCRYCSLLFHRLRNMRPVERRVVLIHWSKRVWIIVLEILKKAKLIKNLKTTKRCENHRQYKSLLHLQNLRNQYTLQSRKDPTGVNTVKGEIKVWFRAKSNQSWLLGKTEPIKVLILATAIRRWKMLWIWRTKNFLKRLRIQIRSSN